jgi:hypothetical protein
MVFLVIGDSNGCSVEKAVDVEIQGTLGKVAIDVYFHKLRLMDYFHGKQKCFVCCCCTSMLHSET